MRQYASATDGGNNMPQQFPTVAALCPQSVASIPSRATLKGVATSDWGSLHMLVNVTRPRPKPSRNVKLQASGLQFVENTQAVPRTCRAKPRGAARPY